MSEDVGQANRHVVKLDVRPEVHNTLFSARKWLINHINVKSLKQYFLPLQGKVTEQEKVTVFSIVLKQILHSIAMG